MEEQYEQHLKIRAQYPVDQLHRIWNETEPPFEIVHGTIFKRYEFGSKGLTKMICFAAETEIKNIDIDYWMAIRPARIEGETYEDYKIRLKFQKALLKYRSTIYKYSNITKKQVKHARKQTNKQYTVTQA